MASGAFGGRGSAAACRSASRMRSSESGWLEKKRSTTLGRLCCCSASLPNTTAISFGS